MHLSLVNINAYLLELVFIAVHDSDSQNQLLGVVVIEDTVQIISETLQENRSVITKNYLVCVKTLNNSMCSCPTCVDLLCNLLHSQFTISHVLAVELDTQQPRRNASHVEVGHLIVDVHPLLVLGHHCVLGVGVVVDGGVGCHLSKKANVYSLRQSKMKFFC